MLVDLLRVSVRYFTVSVIPDDAPGDMYNMSASLAIATVLYHMDTYYMTLSSVSSVCFHSLQ